MSFGKYLLIILFLVVGYSDENLNGGSSFDIISERKLELKEDVVVESDATTQSMGKKKKGSPEYMIQEVLYHNSSCFTQGIVYDSIEKRFYESCGQYGQSFVQMYSLQERKVYSRKYLPASVFGEGVAKVGDQLLVLSWREKTGFIYDIKGKKLTLKRRIMYQTSSGDGWGTTMGTLMPSKTPVVFVSDGSCTIHAWDSKTFVEIQRKCIVDPLDNNSPIKNINDMQFAKGMIYANIWLMDMIAVIDWEKGIVVKWIDFSDIKEKVKLPIDSYKLQNAVLNGIAYDESTDDFYITGKLWNHLFRVRIL